jgi:ABC-type Mn2+/Zn2+ transport system permease subunit
MGAAADHLDHVKTQLVYAITVGAVATLLGYIPLALGVPLILVLPLTIAVIFGIIFFIGKPVDQ